MSWITRWEIKDMRKWGSWHSLEDREIRADLDLLLGGGE